MFVQVEELLSSGVTPPSSLSSSGNSDHTTRKTIGLMRLVDESYNRLANQKPPLKSSGECGQSEHNFQTVQDGQPIMI